MVIIRPAARADIALLPAVEAAAAQLFRGTHAEAFATGPTTHLQGFRRARRAGLLWVAEHLGQPVGFILAETCPEGLYLRELAVMPAVQRRGIGAALMGAAIARAGSIGAAAVLLTTDRTLPWNAPFYARLGFGIVEGDAMPDTLRRRLAGQAADGFIMAHRCAMVLWL